MKKIFISFLALAALCTTAAAQEANPFEWQAGENTKIKLGGYVRLNVNSDIEGGVSNGNDFIASKISDPAWNEDGYLNFDPSATRLSLQITQKTESIGDVKVFIEGDFRGEGSYNVRLRQAYVEFLGIVAGQTWSFMTDLPASAPTVDINGVGSRTFLRTRLIGYRHDLSDHLSAGISIENPSIKSTYADPYCSVTQTTPNIPLYIQYKGKAGHLRAAVMYRSLQYGQTDTQERMSTNGYGYSLSGSFKASKSLTLYGQGIQGKGINTFISDMASATIALMSLDNDTMEATPMGGASLGLNYKFNKKWSASLSGSFAENYGDAEYFDGLFEKTTYMQAALFYNPAPRVTIGAELLNGTLSNFGESRLNARRASLMFKYTL